MRASVSAGLSRGDLPHRGLVGFDPCALRRDVGAREETGHCVDVAHLTPARCPGAARLVDGRLASGDGLRRAVAAEGIAPVGERNAPVRHGAGGILGGNRLELPTSLREPERVQERHGAVHVGLDRRAARGLEVDRTHLCRRQRTASVRLVLRERRHAERTHRCHQDDRSHLAAPLPGGTAAVTTVPIICQNAAGRARPCHCSRHTADRAACAGPPADWRRRPPGRLRSPAAGIRFASRAAASPH